MTKTATMSTKQFFIPILTLLLFSSCGKESSIDQKGSPAPQIIPIPNGDFELWDNIILDEWQTNPCTYCVPAFETYVVQKDTDAAHGQFAAKFIYNGVYSSFANNKFPISLHPTLLTGYIKANIANGDTATIHIDLFSGGNIVDIGDYYETSSVPGYKKIEVPISQSFPSADSALIKIAGGKKQNTELYVDNLVFLKNN